MNVRACAVQHRYSHSGWNVDSVVRHTAVVLGWSVGVTLGEHLMIQPQWVEEYSTAV